MSIKTLLAFCALSISSAAFAQIAPGQLRTSDDPPAARLQTNSEPLTLGQKYRLALGRSVDPVELLRTAAAAAINQGRDYPREWGQGWDAFGVRMASGFGQQLVREQIEFGVWAIDHEDPRYRRSGLQGIWPRTRYAIVHTFVAYRDNGSQMPAYSQFIGDYGAGFISREWYPTRFHTVPQGIEAGSVSLGLDVALNVAREFIPHRFIH